MEFGTESEKAIMRGKEALGYVLVSSAVAHAAMDNVTGAGPAPGKDRDLWLRTHQPYSIRVGDQWVSYRGVPGVEVINSVMADAFELTKELPDSTAGEIFAAATYFVTNAITDRSFFQGLADASAVMDTRNWTLRGIQQSVGEFVNNTAGNSGLRRQMENALASNMTEYKNWLHGVISKATGGLAGALTDNQVGTRVDRLDVLTGKPMRRGNEHWTNSINPFTVVDKDRSPLVETFNELEYPLNDNLLNNLDGVQLTGEERTLFAQGMYDDGNFPKALRSLFSSKRWQRKYEAWLERVNSGDGEPREEAPWYQDINSVVNRYRNKGRDLLRHGQGRVSDEFRVRTEAASRREFR